MNKQLFQVEWVLEPWTIGRNEVKGQVFPLNLHGKLSCKN